MQTTAVKQQRRTVDETENRGHEGRGGLPGGPRAALRPEAGAPCRADTGMPERQRQGTHEATDVDGARQGRKRHGGNGANRHGTHGHRPVEGADGQKAGATRVRLKVNVRKMPQGLGTRRSIHQDAAGRDKKPGLRQLPARVRLLAGSLLVMLSALFATPAQAQSHCDATDPDELWCATLTVGSGGGNTGFNNLGLPPYYGSLTPSSFTYKSATITPGHLEYTGAGLLVVNLTGSSVPGWEHDLVLEFGSGTTKKTFRIETSSTALNINTTFSDSGLSWSDNDRIPVKILLATRVANVGVSAPAGTASFLQVTWEALEDSPGGYHVRAQPTTSTFTEDQRRKYFTDGITTRVDGSARSHTFYKLVPGIRHRAQVCRVTARDENTAFLDTLGKCSPWQTIRLPAASSAHRNDIKVSLEFPDGSAKATLGPDDNTSITYRVRVSGLNDLSRLDPPFGGGASWALILKASDTTDTIRVGNRGEVPRYFNYVARGAGLRQLTWDRAGSGYVEGSFPLSVNQRARGPLIIELLDPHGDDEPLGEQRSLCIEFTDSTDTLITACPSSGSQEAADPPTVVGTPTLSGAGTDGSWTQGEKVGVSVTFSEAVDVDTTGGTPTIGVQLGGPEGTAKSATYEGGSGTTELTFGYTLVEADGTHSTMGVAANSLATGGGTIRSSASDVDADLTHVGTASPGSLARTGGPTATFQNVPATHDGASAFTVEVQFSGTPAGLNAKRDAASALEVAGGSVTKARQTASGTNPVWEVTVTPSGAGDVTVTVPVRACNESPCNLHRRTAAQRHGRDNRRRDRQIVSIAAGDHADRSKAPQRHSRSRARGRRPRR